jgi:putative adenylate-forming enzyme
VACQYGHIHLNEDDVLFEQEAIVGHPQHFVPIITDLKRRAQVMIRYRLNDVLVKLDGPCPCGSPLLALARVEGRCDDVLEFNRQDGTRVTVMPEALRAVILDADRRIADFRLVQGSTGHLQLTLNEGAEVAEKVRLGLLNYLIGLGVEGDFQIDLNFGIVVDHSSKLRRISCGL